MRVPAIAARSVPLPRRFAGAAMAVGQVLILAVITDVSAAQCLQNLPAATPPSTLSLISPRSLQWDHARSQAVFLNNLGETWAWNGASFERRTNAYAPWASRTYVVTAFDRARAKLVAFGGRANLVDSGDTREWDGQSWTLVASDGPAPRAGHAMAYDTLHQRVLLVGGFPASETCSNYFGDTWAWDGAQWTLLADAALGPGIRGDSSMAFDEARGVLVLYGGYRNCTGALEDTWEFDGNAWANRTPSPQPANRPPASYTSAMYYNSRLARVELVTTGSSANALVWSWNGQQWTPRSFIGPTPGSGIGYTGAAFDPTRTEVLFTNGGNLQTDGIRRLGDGRPSVNVSGASILHARVGGSTPPPFSFRVNQTSLATPVNYQWRRNAVPITSGFAGFTSPQLFFPSTLTSSSFGEFTCAVTNPCGTTISPPMSLLVACAADVYHAADHSTLYVDDAVTIDDLLQYLFLFETGSIHADLDDGSASGTPDGGVNIDDLLYYLEHFENGC